MSNGTALGGNIQSNRGAVIIPKPGSTTIYYIFTAPKQSFDVVPTYFYSEIDMSLAGGLGAVTINKKIPLYAPGTEKIAVVSHANGIDYWIITKEDNYFNHRFRVYPVTCNGPQLSSPVLSAAFPTGPGSGGHHFGSLNISPDGQKLVDILPIWRLPNGQETQGFNLFGFDNSNGVVSAPVRYIDPNSTGIWYYAAEFSADSKFLYAINSKKLTQFKVDVLSASAIAASAYEIPTAFGGALTSLQIGPDRKIYLSGNRSIGGFDSVLAVIQNPAGAGISCNYTDTAIFLKRRISMLPNFPVNLVLNTEADFNFTGSGNCSSYVFSASSVFQGPVQFEWDFGDNSNGTGQTITHAFPPDSISYVVTLVVRKTGQCGKTVRKKKVITVNQKISTADFEFQSDCDHPRIAFTNYSTVTPPYSASGYLWTFGDGNSSLLQNPVHTYNNFGSYAVSLTVYANANCGLPITLIKNITILPHPSAVFAGQDTTVFAGAYLQLAGAGTMNCVWSPVSGLSDPYSCAPLVNTSSGADQFEYVLSGVDATGCPGKDTIRIKIANGVHIYVPNSFTPNQDGLNDILRPVCVGIRKVNSFRIYDRWSNLIYSGAGFGAGWNGSYKGGMLQGSFVWIAQAETLDGKKIEKKGMVLLLR